MDEQERTVAVLLDIIESKDEELGELHRRIHNLERELKAKWIWTKPEPVEPIEQLPVPRLEIVWRPEESGRGYRWEARYQLVYQFYNELVGVAISSTSVGGHRDLSPMMRRGPTFGSPDQEWPETPFRDGVHILRDSDHLNLPAFVRQGDIVFQLTNTEQPEPERIYLNPLYAKEDTPDDLAG